MPTVKILPEPKRTCEQSLAFRATVSPPELRRILPKRALAPMLGPSPTALLRELMAYPFPEALWVRMAQEALDSKDPDKINEAISKLDGRITDHKKGQAKLQRLLPNLFPKAA
jgi:hypothetical protein